MKKFLMIFGLVISLFGFSFTSSYASDLEKHKAISEIGILSNAEKYEEALEKCEAALIKYPDEPELYYWSGAIKLHQGDAEDAIKDFDEAIKLNPNESSIYVMRGMTKSDIEDDNGALEDYNYALKINPKDSSAYSMRACVKLKMGDLEGANDDLNKANELYDEHERNLENK